MNINSKMREIKNHIIRTIIIKMFNLEKHGLLQINRTIIIAKAILKT